MKRYKRLLSLIAVPLLILALTLSPAVGADDGGDIKVKSSITDMPEASKRPMIWDGSRAWEGDINFLPPYEVPAGYSYEAPGYENGDHGVNAADMDDIPVADDCTVLGDEELLDSVWEKACTDIELPDGAILTIKAVIAPEESNVGGVPAVIWVNTPSEEFGKTHCSYYFQHLVDRELVDGDKYVIVINADTLERVPIVQRTPYYITGSIEASDATARPMIWDGSSPTLRIGPFHEVPAAYSMYGPDDPNPPGWEYMRDLAFAEFDNYFPYDGNWHSYRGFNDVSEDEDFICAPETSMHYAIAHSVGSGANMGYWAQSPHDYVYPSDVEDWMGDRHPMELDKLMSCHAMGAAPNYFEGAFRRADGVDVAVKFW